MTQLSSNDIDARCLCKDRYAPKDEDSLRLNRYR